MLQKYEALCTFRRIIASHDLAIFLKITGEKIAAKYVIFKAWSQNCNGPNNLPSYIINIMGPILNWKF